MPDLVKIGKTTRLSSDRAREIENEFRSVTGLPYGFRVAYDWEVTDCHKAEKFIHLQLSDFKANKEWFELSLKDAIDRISQLILANELDYKSYINKIKLCLDKGLEELEENNYEEALAIYRQVRLLAKLCQG